MKFNAKTVDTIMFFIGTAIMWAAIFTMAYHMSKNKLPCEGEKLEFERNKCGNWSQ